MTWAEYYERYDGWQESTQYSRLASIKDFGPDGSPSEEICDCIQYVDTRTATSILRRALAAGVRFRAAEVAEIADSGQIEDEEALEKLIQTAVDAYTGEQLDTLLSCLPDPEPVFELIDKITSKPTHFTEEDVLTLLPNLPDEESIYQLVNSTDAIFTENGLNELCDYGVDESLIRKISKRSGIPYADPDEPDEEISLKEAQPKKPGMFSSILMGMALAGSPKPKKYRQMHGRLCSLSSPLWLSLWAMVLWTWAYTWLRILWKWRMQWEVQHRLTSLAMWNDTTRIIYMDTPAVRHRAGIPLA